MLYCMKWDGNNEHDVLRNYIGGASNDLFQITNQTHYPLFITAGNIQRYGYTEMLCYITTHDTAIGVGSVYNTTIYI